MEKEERWIEKDEKVKEEEKKEERDGLAWESLDAVLFLFSMHHMSSNVSSLYLLYLLLLFRH